MKTYLETLADKLEGVSASQLFGKPSLKKNNAHFVCGFRDCLVVKIGREAIAEKRGEFEGAVLFDPSGKGRPMKDWLQVPRAYQGEWLALAQQALEWVS